MTTIWRVDIDRYGDECKAKSDRLYSIIETADMLIEEYKEQRLLPKLEIVIIGIGAALSDYLTDKKIPHTEIKGLVHRVGCADVFKYKGGD